MRPTITDTKKLNKLIKNMGFVLGTAPDHIHQKHQFKVLGKTINGVFGDLTFISYNNILLCVNPDQHRCSLQLRKMEIE